VSPAPAKVAPRLGSLCTGYGGLDLAAASVFHAKPTWFADPASSPTTTGRSRTATTSPESTSLSALPCPEVAILTAGWPRPDILIAERGEGTKK
jgi:DNA (cytosine-5)-methyltransferase 1